MLRKHINRRHFLRASALATLATGASPLILPKAYAGSATIIDISGDKRISLVNACLARPFDIGGWTCLRFGIRFKFLGTASTDAVTPRFVMGLNSGGSDFVFDATSTNFIGFRTTTATWTFSDSTIDNYTSALKATTRVGSTWTDHATAVNSVYLSTYGNSSSTTVCAIFMEIIKGDPNWTIVLFYPNAYNAPQYTDRATMFIPNMTAVTMTASSGYTYSSSFGVPFSESNGVVDHILIGWDRPEFGLSITDIAVSKIS